LKKNNLYTVICSWAGLEIMMETTSSSFNIEFEDYIGLFLHKITGNEKELKQIISYVNNLIKLKKEKEGEEYSGMLDNTDIIDLQFFLNKESYYDSKILKDLNINYQQLSKQPQIYNLN
tara:strand:- start:87 stop:443 length:357 start_codon:yes stop_codon:yes gene_type:complete